MNDRPLLRSILKLAAVLQVPLLALIAITASANMTNTWRFASPADYEVSDPALIQVVPGGDGRAELIPQPTPLDSSSLTGYLNGGTFSGVRVGSEQLLELVRDNDGKYVAPGIFRSRVIDKGVGSGSWDALFARVSNAMPDIGPDAVQFRLRSSAIPAMSGDFGGPDGTADSYYSGMADRLEATGNFNPIHRYLQYEVRLFTDVTRTETPLLQYVKFVTRDGAVHADGTAGDFLQGTPVQNVTNAPYTAYTPYLGLAREANGGFRTAGTYRSEPFDSQNPNSVWERLRWRLPQTVSNVETGLVALYRLDGNWGDVAPLAGANNPTVQSNTAFSANARLGFNAALFSAATGGSVVSGFFTTTQEIATVSFWIRAASMNDGILQIGDGSVGIRDHQIVTDGFGDNSPAIYVNANPQSAALRPGWNHVALVWPAVVNAQTLLVGRADGDHFTGLLDEMALYSRALTMGEILVQYYNAHPISAGVPTFRVRAADTLTALNGAAWSVPFSDPSAAVFSVRGRYFQYEAAFAGDGNDTPVAGHIRVEGNDGVQSFAYATATFSQAARGDFGGGSTAWHGDEIYVENFAATDPSNLTPLDFDASDFLAGLWHFDEPVWGAGTVLVDSSGRGRPGSPVNGAASSPNARVGFRSGYFDGADDYVELAQIAELAGTDFSVGLWFNSSDTRDGSLISTFAGSGAYFEITLNHDGTQSATGKMAFVINDGANGVRAAVSPVANMNNAAWRHVVGVRAGNYIHLYVDGARVATTAIGAYGTLTPGTPRIMRNGTGSRYLEGNVDEVAFFGSALSPKKVGTLYASGFSPRRVNEMIFDPVDAGGATVVWQTLRWTTDGIYGSSLSPAATIRGLWNLDEAAGGAALDSSGGGRNAVAAGTSPVPGVFGNARYFNGTSDHLRVPHNMELEADGFSVEFWVRPESLNNRVLVDKRAGGNGYALLTDATGRLMFQLGGATLSDSLPLLMNLWQHVAASYDGTVMRLYVNGILRGSLVPMGVSPASGADLYIGRAVAGGSFLRGGMDEIAYHTRRLLDMEILDHYRAYAGTLKFQVRAGSDLPLNDVFHGPDGTTNTYFSWLQEGNLAGVVPLVRYLQVKAYIGTDDHRFTPTFYGLSVSASRYPENAPWIAPTAARGYPFLGNLLGFDHARTFNPNTDVRYQISGDSGLEAVSRWFYYDAGTGQWTMQNTNSPAIYDFQTSTRNTVAANIGKFYSQVYNATGGLFRFKAFLKSGGDQQVAVSNVTVTVSRGRIVMTSPNGQERGKLAWIASVPYPVTWSWQGTVSDNLELAYSINGYAGPWTVIATGLAKGPDGANSRLWTTPQQPQGVATLTNVVVRIRDLNDATVMDMSDAPFEITQKFKVTVPNGGERWYIGEANTVRWESAHDLSTRASLYMAPDGEFGPAAAYYDTNLVCQIEFLATNINSSANNAFVWQTPRHVASLLSTNAKIRVQAPTGQFADDSDDPFSMLGIVITSPAAGQRVNRNDQFTVQWRSVGAGANVHMDISLDGGATYETNIYSFVTNADGDNSLAWNVTHPGSDTTVLRLRSFEDDRIIGISDMFTIAGIDVLAPDGGEEWLAGSQQQIRWMAGGAGSTVSIFFTDLYEGANTVWLPIVQAYPNVHDYSWTVSDKVSPLARVKIQSDEDPGLFAISEQNFNIAGVKVKYPNLFSDTLIMGRPALMTHAGAPMRWLRVKLEISYDRAATWQVLGPGAEEWTLSQPFLFSPTFPSSQTKVRATVLGATTPLGAPLTNIVDLSDEYFEVHGMVMEAPAAGSTNTLGTQSEIRWVSAGDATVAAIYYSALGTNNFTLIAQGVFNNQTYPGRNPYTWQIPATLLPSTTARIKVASGNYEAITAPFLLRGIRVTAPTNNAVLPVGTLQAVAWTYAGMNVTSRGTISLSLDGGTTFTALEGNYDLISIPFYNWNIDPDLNPTTNALIRLRVLSSDTPADIGFTAVSDRFTLKGIKILTPAPGGAVRLGETTPISFIAAAAGQSARIEYSSDGGATYDPLPIAQNLEIGAATTTFNWTIETTRTPSTNAVIRITGTADAKVSGVFTLGGIRVDRPMQYDIWAVGENNPIEWVAQVAEPVFNLDLVYPDGFVWPVAQNAVGNTRTYQLPALALRGQETLSNIVLRVSDRQGTATGLSAPFRLVNQPIIEIVSPRAGDFLRVGDEVQVIWVKGGSMREEDFSVWFSRDGFATPPEDINRGVTLNTGNNTFSMPWLVPDRLGRTQVMVTNSLNPTLVSISGEFDIVGAFDLIYPNGDPGEEPIYANQTKAVNWFTQGSVEFVNIFYKVAGDIWIKANSEPVPNQPRQGRYQTFYQWTVPVLRADAVMLRVQDASYPDPNQFDGTRIGPYDDSDGTFGFKFFTVTWNVLYADVEAGTNTPLDNLSVTDSAGWTVSNIDSPFITNYPYGIFDTVWSRHLFNDKVDFRWLCDRDQVRSLLMTPLGDQPTSEFIFSSFGGIASLSRYSGMESSVMVPRVYNALIVTSIGSGAFAGNPNLIAVTLPDSITSIASGALAGCPNLLMIDVAPDNANYRGFGGVLFDKELTTLVQFPGGRSGSYRTPDSVTRIGSFAFADNLGLSVVKLGPLVANLDERAFAGVRNLRYVLLQGLPPICGPDVFWNAMPTICYRYAHRNSWTPVWAGRPTTLWPEFGHAFVQAGGRGFAIHASTGRQILIQALDNLENGMWETIAVPTVPADDTLPFLDPDQAQRPKRFYRVVLP